MTDTATVGTWNPDALLLPYQLAWIADKSQVKVCAKSRRTGLTWAEAADSTIEAARAKGGQDTWYIGYNQEMAREFIEAVGMWAKAFGAAAESVAEILVEDEDASILAYRVTFASGNKVVALSSRPSNLRGKQGRVVIDEAAFHAALDELLKAAIALTMWGGVVRIISTHDGADNPFNLLIEEIRAKRKTYSYHEITFADAVKQGLYRKIAERLGKPWTQADEDAWVKKVRSDYGEHAAEELDVIPRAGGGVYLPRALVAARQHEAIKVLRWSCKDEFVHLPESIRKADALGFCTEEILPLLKLLDQSQPCAIGGDCGRSGDLTVLWPLQVDRFGVRVTPFVVELRNVPFQQQRDILWFITDALPRLVGAKFDARGIGAQIAEETMQRYGAERVEEVKATIDWYRTNMPPMKAAFEDAQIVIPRDDDILADLRTIKVERGVPMVSDVRTKSKDGKQRHGDSAIALCLAYAAANLPLAEYDYTAIPRNARSSHGFTESDDVDDDADDMKLSRRFEPGAW